ncbi:hypothetical protein QC761_507117 [Podospora bellae-mahoneyi]|uniref:Uncharacterized protein n=1 Tax=Podospora bellae-mahoneyi TaxID=2093777 RepID=A0ABR0FGI4_9PEZI|nr:hypothetical protein QC761_507117 [Podospora bellae-mahoneyi]
MHQLYSPLLIAAILQLCSATTPLIAKPDPHICGLRLNSTKDHSFTSVHAGLDIPTLSLRDGSDKQSFRWGEGECYAMAFADDHTIIIISPDWRTNLKIITISYNAMKKRADENGVTFAPAKYAMMHFRQTRDNNSPPQGPSEECQHCVRKLRVPGVIFNSHLSWIDHARHLQVKVLKIEQYMRRISSSIRGPPTWQMRSLFCSNVRPVLFYAGAAWYRPDNKRHADSWNTALKMLEAAQRKCLVVISGAVKYPPSELLLHELRIGTVDRLLWKYRLIASQHPIIKAYAHAARYHPRLLRWSLSRPPTVPNGTTRNTLSPLSYRPRAEVRQGYQSESRQRPFEGCDDTTFGLRGSFGFRGTMGTNAVFDAAWCLVRRNLTLRRVVRSL